MNAISEKYRQFTQWQQRPHEVMPMSEESHVCPTCGTSYTGNYCPRCGQSAKIGRYSFKKAMLLFLDVWGLGNRGMFRSIRDLLLRPGYMIRDYLKGMQMAYFPPFKMFFLLVTLSLFIESGFNITGKNRIAESIGEFNAGFFDSQSEVEGTSESDSELSEKQKQIMIETLRLARKSMEWTYQHMTLVSLSFLFLFSGPLYFWFRRCPAIPDLKYSEFFVALVYISNMLTIYSVVLGFLCLNPLLETLTYPLAIIPLKQLSGYSYGRTVWYIIASFLLFFIATMLCLFAFGIIMGLVAMIQGA
ncbi:MAG: DUF3667 domain-containing protein [Bacteroidales bacterium]|nr:DUF3667 domain-containing protein [Bacteroidales bacterium]MBP5214407.1 DUF3667 domain-containing protein [Bacteroidales bacterium]